MNRFKPERSEAHMKAGMTGIGTDTNAEPASLSHSLGICPQTFFCKISLRFSFGNPNRPSMTELHRRQVQNHPNPRHPFQQ
ncbi:MAG: hypothetical protein RLZZ488_1224 [Pseudomonadota bacterium]